MLSVSHIVHCVNVNSKNEDNLPTVSNVDFLIR